MPRDIVNEVFLSILQGGDKEYKESRLKEFSGDDWAAVKNLVMRRRIFPLFYTRLLNIAPENIPPEVAYDFKTAYLVNLKKNILLERELLWAILILNKAGIPVMPLKGVFLARYLYNDLALRQTSGDLDMLIKREDVEKASRLLEEDGYALDGIKREMNLYLRFNRAVQFVKKVPGLGGFRLDVHWNFCDRFIDTHVKDMWANAKDVRLGAVEVKAPSVEDLLLFLSLKAILGSEFVNMRYLTDIDRLISSFGGELDWRIVVDRAKRIGANAVLFFSLRLCKDIFDSPVKEDVLNAFRPDPIRERMYERYLSKDAIIEYGETLRFTYFWRYMIVSLIASKNMADFLSAVLRKNGYLFFKTIYVKTIRPLRLCKHSM